MNRSLREWAWRLAERRLRPREVERIRAIPVDDQGFGYDAFGMELESALLAYVVFSELYDHWFRVESVGHEHIPADGRALLVPNHSGLLPLDAVMIAVDLVRKMEHPRILRAVVDHFVGGLPFVGNFMYRAGQVIGNRDNFEALLERDQLVGVFPEGTRGIGKHFRRRYRLVRFNVGFVELALRYQAPIVPTAVIGAEEQAPILYDVKPLARALGLPFFPITPTFPWLGPLGLMPYPSQYHIVYGEPLHLYRDHPPETVDEPETVRALADKVQLRLQEMVDEALREYGLFALGTGYDWDEEGDGS